MATVLRISGREALTITISNMTPSEVARLRDLVCSSSSGAGYEPALSVSSSPAAAQLLLHGTAAQLKHIVAAASEAGGGLAVFLQRVDSLLDNHLRSDYKIDCRGKVLDLGSRTHVMGILNVTPDSFSDGGRFASPDRALAHARDMVAAGADIIDIGGESTRPGAEPVSEEEELRRVIPLIERLGAELAVPVSVDTYKASVAEKALAAGASMVNDISGLRFSPDMARIVAACDAAVVVMHIQGTPRNMQQNPVYGDVVAEVRDSLGESIDIALRAGVNREKIIIDPGIGFGKTLEHNLTLIDHLDAFRVLGRPVMLGTSRKKFIGTILGISEPEQRVDGSAATVALGIERGASIVRVHDVARMVQVARMTDAVIKQS
ncbi:MAG TPA: dihydropteroate synthase [Nitrospirota bacterium]|nr:dihydropteroate synthase [Nitrospirota bacterium]